MTAIKMSRRSMLKSGAAAVKAAVVIGTSQALAQVTTKSPPQVAGYQDRANGSQSCNSCMHFQSPSACKVVAGRISPQGWCKLYFARAR